MKKLCPRSHWEPVKRDNGVDAYCMKEDTRVEGPWEFGEKPVRHNKKEDWDEVFAKAKAGEFDKIPAEIRVKHYHNL